MSQLVVELCDPRSRGAEIKSLFARNGKPGFETVFEHIYQRRAEHGLRSWVGLIGDEAVMHISVTPVRFTDGQQTMTGGLLGDLMVDQPHRDFWAPVRLLRTMVSDLRKTGDIDFLLTTTVADAEPVFKAGGFKPFGTIRRYVLPLNLPYLIGARLRGRIAGRQAQPTGLPWGEASSLWSLPRTATWRPLPEADYYNTRIPRAGFVDGTWLSVVDKRSGHRGAALLSRRGDRPEVNLADAFWQDNDVRLGEVAHAAARWARKQRFAKLAVATLQESRVAQQMTKAGFFERDFMSTLFIQRIGANAPPAVEDWFLPGFVFTSW